MSSLKIENLHAQAEDKKILRGINLELKSGEIHAIMGKNGSGKSTLCSTIIGHPNYKSTKGEIKLNGKNILKISPDKIANLGIFASFQHPVEIPGVSLTQILKTAKNLPLTEVLEKIKPAAKKLHIPENILTRSLNTGFSGGEKKKFEILQMLILEPKIIILDEIDSGLDIDALKTVSRAIMEYIKEFKPIVLLVTHYQRILNYIHPDFVHIMVEGQIVKSGKKDLAKKIEKEGYDKYLEQ